MKRYPVKNPFYLNDIIQVVGDVIELDEDQVERLAGKDVIGKEISETPTPSIVPLNLDAFEALNAGEQKAELSRLGVEGDDSNKELRVALYAAYLDPSVNVKNNQEAGGPDAQTKAGDASNAGTSDEGSDQESAEI